mgnify:CR=1 FL=1
MARWCHKNGGVVKPVKVLTVSTKGTIGVVRAAATTPSSKRRLGTPRHQESGGSNSRALRFEARKFQHESRLALSAYRFNFGGTQHLLSPWKSDRGSLELVPGIRFRLRTSARTSGKRTLKFQFESLPMLLYADNFFPHCPPS